MEYNQSRGNNVIMGPDFRLHWSNYTQYLGTINTKTLVNAYTPIFSPDTASISILHSVLKKLKDISPFCGATDIPVLDFWVSKPGWLPSHACFIACVNRIFRFTSGVTPADLLAASMAAEPFSSMYLQTSIGGA